MSRSSSENDRRLVSAGIPVALGFSLVFGHMFTRQNPFSLPFLEAAQQQKTAESKIYPVLVEQRYRPPQETDQFRALSDVTAEGKGRITLGQGFHTMSSDDTFQDSAAGQTGGSRTAAARQMHGKGPKIDPSEKQEKAGSGRQGDEAQLRIPMNYRFQQDFVLAYDGSSRFSIARQEMAGFRYFQSMLRQIKENFSPPGLNYAYRDMAGTVVNQPIKPQIVEILFLLDEKGNVRDVRKTSSMGQEAVDRACLESIIGQNFGPPPPEVFSHGNVFGIGFIFPAVMH